jgi:hypothetical protein
MCAYGLHNCSRWRVILKVAFEGWRIGGFCLTVRDSPYSEGLWFESTLGLAINKSFLASFPAIFKAEL